MSNIPRGTRDPRAYRQELGYTREEVVGRVTRAYGSGYQDAVNLTVELADNASTTRALTRLADGDPKPYRKLMKRKFPLD